MYILDSVNYENLVFINENTNNKIYVSMEYLNSGHTAWVNTRYEFEELEDYIIVK